jgi:DeoR/GlpR family transcriptional regulator of sugar metabolism
MLSIERKQRILNYITAHRTAQIHELCSLLQVSVATIRRDLTKMEAEGLIYRVHGGAMTLESYGEPAVLQRKTTQAESKRRIGEKAAEFVQDGETIFLSGGTTTEMMIPFLAQKKELTVITNGINLVEQLACFPQIGVIVTGGWLRHSELSLLGHLTEQAVQDLRAAKVFYGVFGLDPEYGLTGSNVQEAQTDRCLIQTANQLFLLADHTKFHRIGQIRLAGVDVISTVITDREAPEAGILALQAKGIKVIQS